MRQLKERLKQAIDRLEDEDPKIAKAAKILGLPEEIEGGHPLTPEQTNLIAQSEAEIESGKFFTDSEIFGTTQESLGE